MTGEEYGELFRQACDLFENNEYDKSEEICNRLIEVNDKQAPIFNLLGLIKAKKGDINSAIKNLEIAVNLDSTDYVYLCNLGEFYRKVNKLDLALEYLEKSIGINFQYPYSLYNLGNIHRDLGNKGEAEKYYELAIKYKPDYYQAMNNLGLLYMESHYVNLAEEFYKKALKVKPDDCEILVNLALAELFLKKMDESELNLRKCILINSIYAEPYRILANLLADTARINESREMLIKYLELTREKLDETSITAQELRISLISEDFYQSNQDIDKYIDKINSVIKNKYIYTNVDFIQDLKANNIQISGNFSYNGRDNKDLKIKYSEAFYDNFPIYHLKNNSGKIKIGFLVTKFKEKIFLKFMEGVLKRLSLEIFDIYLICDKNQSIIYFNNVFEKFIKRIYLSNQVIDSSKIIKDLNLDILYFWECCTDSDNYFLSFFRMAHVQCTSIGWPETTGVKTMDYFISGELIEIENAQEHYSETLVKTKKLPLYCSKPQLIDFKFIDYFKLPKNKKIYFCGQNIRKIHPDFDYLVLNILKKDTNGIIIFINDKSKSISSLLKQRLEAVIIDKSIIDRVIFLEQINNYQDYLSLVSQVDVVLDTLYFGGANTSYDFFAMGAPVVTYPWTHERGRYTLGCYKQMEIEGLVANSLDEYVDLAVKTANDKEFRDKIVKDIKENNYKLYDDNELIQEYNELFKNLAIKHREKNIIH